jgi:hypothetical protein
MGCVLKRIPRKGITMVNENNEKVVDNKDSKILTTPLIQYGTKYFKKLPNPFIF